MEQDHRLYLRWILNELNTGLELNPFTRNIFTPFVYDEIVNEDAGISQIDRVLVAAEIYRWIMGGKYRLLDLENIIRQQKEPKEFSKKTVKDDIKVLIEGQELLNGDVLKMVLLLTGLDQKLVDDAKYVVQKRFLYTGASSKLWSSIGYYNMQDKSVHVSTGGKSEGKQVTFQPEHIIETAAHELGHHIYISMISKRFKVPNGTIKNIRALLKGVKTSKSRLEHDQWIKFYRKDYSTDWDKNKAIQIIPKEVYIRYGIENELFAQVISGKTTISRTKRKKLISLINESCDVK